MTFSEKLKYYRNKKRLTQSELAKAAGISRRTYLYYESGDKYPRKRDTVIALARCLGTEPDDLLPENDMYISGSLGSLPFEEQARLMKSCAEIVFGSTVLTAEQKQSIYNAVSELYLSSVPALEANNDQTDGQQNEQ